MAQSGRYLTALAIVSLALVAAIAQPAAPPARRFEFTVFSIQPLTGMAYSPGPEAAPVLLSFYPTARSPRYSYAGPARFPLFDAQTGAIVAEVVTPPEIRKALFILLPRGPGREAGPPFEVVVVRDDAGARAAGSLLILNLSGLALSGSVNQRPLTLLNGFNEPLPVGRSASINLRTPFKDRTYQAYAETLVLDESSRALLLLLPPYRRGSLEVQSRVLVDAPANGSGVQPR